MHFIRPIAAVFLLAATACAPNPAATAAGDPLVSGTVYHVGKSKLTLITGTKYSFLSLDEADASKLKKLRKGDAVTIYGERITENGHESLLLNEIVRNDGLHISFM